MFEIEFYSNNMNSKANFLLVGHEASHPLSDRMEDFPHRKSSSSTLDIVVAAYPHSCLSSSIHHSYWPQKVLSILPPTILSDHHPCHLNISSSNPYQFWICRQHIPLKLQYPATILHALQPRGPQSKCLCLHNQLNPCIQSGGPKTINSINLAIWKQREQKFQYLVCWIIFSKRVFYWFDNKYL
jgi:hypothetical protein